MASSAGPSTHVIVVPAEGQPMRFRWSQIEPAHRDASRVTDYKPDCAIRSPSRVSLVRGTGVLTSRAAVELYAA